MSEAIDVRSSSRPGEWGDWASVSTRLQQADGYTIAVWSDSHATVTVEVGVGPSGYQRPTVALTRVASPSKRVVGGPVVVTTHRECFVFAVLTGDREHLA